MKHCSICDVDVDSKNEFCPLCHNALDDVSEKETPEMFPEYKEKLSKKSKAKTVIIKVFLILSVFIIAASMFINIGNIEINI